MGDTLQIVGLDTLTDPSADLTKAYTEADASRRLSTVTSILSQKFGSSWKVILILILILLTIVYLVVLLVY